MSPVSPPQNQFCSECGQPRPASELARFGDRLVCPDCKNNYVQKLREGVAPAMAVTYGGFWIRFVAVLIDGIILYIANSIVEFAVIGRAAIPNAATPDDALAALPRVGLSWLISMAIGCAYETFFIAKMAATPGKMAVGLKVIRPDGSPVSVGRAAAATSRKSSARSFS